MLAPELQWFEQRPLGRLIENVKEALRLGNKWNLPNYTADDVDHIVIAGLGMTMGEFEAG